MIQLLRQICRLQSARWTIRQVERRRHKQSAFQLAEMENRITSKQVLCGLAIIGLFIVGCCIDSYGKPDPKVQTVEVRK